MMDLAEFAAQAHGVPFREGGGDRGGWSCWGMLRAAYRECFGLELPDLELCRFASLPEARAAFDAWAVAYREVTRGREKAGDVALLRGEPCHVALVVAQGRMLHVNRDCATHIEPYDRGPWKGRVLGFYRHEQLVSH